MNREMDTINNFARYQVKLETWRTNFLYTFILIYLPWFPQEHWKRENAIIVTVHHMPKFSFYKTLEFNLKDQIGLSRCNISLFSLQEPYTEDWEKVIMLFCFRDKDIILTLALMETENGKPNKNLLFRSQAACKKQFQQWVWCELIMLPKQLLKKEMFSSWN